MKENGFAIGLLVGTLVIGGGLVALGLSQGKRYAGIQSEYSDVKGSVEKMAKVRPFPTQENLEERKTEVKTFRGKVEGLQNTVQNFRPENLEKISPSEFQNRLVTKTAAIKALFEEKGISFPEQFGFGMESYLDALANPDATAKLNYQLEASDWLFRQIAKVETYEIRNVVREALPSESGKVWTQEFEDSREPIPLAQSLPMEVVFLADEPAVNALVDALVDSKKYFFTIDMIRIGNENTSAPIRAQAGLEESEEVEEDGGGGGFGGFGDFEFEDEAAEDAEEAVEEEPVIEDEEAPLVETGRILGQVLGNEGNYVGLQLRLLLFTEPVELPEFN
ncbi:MAG: Amuc_1100 family pilus-like protein [Roseibacillus sp.]